MMDDISDLISKRADSLGLEKQDIMTVAKLIIVDMLRIEVRILSYKNGVMRIATEDSMAASELRLHAKKIIAELAKQASHEQVSFIAVTVR